jgi:hypothetical protein
LEKETRKDEREKARKKKIKERKQTLVVHAGAIPQQCLVRCEESGKLWQDFGTGL